MSVRKWMAPPSVALVAVLALAIVTGGSAAPGKKSDTTKAAVITDIGGLGDKGFNDLCAKGVKTASKQLGIAPARLHLEVVRGLHPESLDRCTTGLQPGRRLRVPDGCGHREGSEAVPEDVVRDHRLQPGLDEERPAEPPRRPLLGE